MTSIRARDLAVDAATDFSPAGRPMQRRPKATPAACTPPAQAKRLDPRVAGEGGALRGPTRLENGGAQSGSARPRGRPRRRHAPVPRALRRPLSLDHPVGDAWHVVDDNYGQTVRKLQAESMMSTAASLFPQ
jgi:hypothetical protein